MRKFFSILLIICMLFSICACNRNDEGKKKDYKKQVKLISDVYFNTQSKIFVYGDQSAEAVEKYVKICDEILGYYHKLFDIYYGYSGINNLNDINKNAGKNAVTVNSDMLDFLEYCKELYTLTQGKTNIMLGSVLKIWHDCREDASRDFGYLDPQYLPTEAELAEAGMHTSMDLLVIDREASTVYISDPLASLDVGAIAKGYVVDIIYQRLKAEGADSVVLNIGGNIRSIGVDPNGEKWEVGITNPEENAENSLLCRISIADASIVTSGDYERRFFSDNVKYHHIIDPETLMPARYFTGISVITDNSALADALSTALFCMSYEEGLALVNSIGGVEVIWVDLEYNMTSTSGISFVD